MTRLGLVLAVAFVLGACGGASSGPAQPKDDPSKGIYNYDDAKAIGIRVDPIPPDEQLCPQPSRGSCIADPRLALIVVGYSVEAVRSAPSAFEKGKLICGGIAMSLPVTNAQGYDRIARQKLRNGYGVDPGDSLEELVAGCRTTDWGDDMLLPD